MGTYYSIYAEVRVGDKWYNLNPVFQCEDGTLDVCPVVSGRNWLRDTYEELEESLYERGRPENISKEVKMAFPHEDDEPYDPDLRINTYKDFYNQSFFLVNYGKAVKCRVKKDKPTRYQGYVTKVALAAYEINEYEGFGHWLTAEEYEKLSDKARKQYTYYEWDEPDDWYKGYNMIVEKVDCMLDYFRDWAYYAIRNVSMDDLSPTADSVRLLVYLS